MSPILVIGDLILDHYIIGEVTRISPEAPVPVVHVKSKEYRLGGCANVANNLVQLGVSTSILSVVGNDTAGKLVTNRLESKGIKNLLIYTNYPTICKTRIIGNSQQIVRFDEEQKINVEEELKEQFMKDENEYAYLIISDYNKGVCSTGFCQKILQQAKEKQQKVIIDPKGKHWNKYYGAYLVTPNLKELSEIAGEKIQNEDELIAAIGEKVRGQFGFENLLVTRSEKGMTLITDSKVSHFKTTVKDVFDITGAGDTVIATITASLYEGYQLEQAVQLANAAAGLVVSKFGTYAISKAELNQVLAP